MKGLTLIENIVTEEDEDFLLKKIYEQKWNTDLSRKTQHYGFKYGYGRQATSSIEPTIPIPDWLQGIRDEVHPEANQAIINHYLPGQGIASHIDNFKFGEKVVSVSLKSGICMDIENEDSTESLYLKPRSCLILEDEARWKFKHGITKRRSDIVDGKSIKRGERISITFRSYNI